MTEPDDLQETLSFRHNVTGIDNTIFISPHGVSIANPPDNLDPRGSIATVTLDGDVIGAIDPGLLRQVQRFIEVNRSALLDYWLYQIDTDQLRQRLRSI